MLVLLASRMTRLTVAVMCSSDSPRASRRVAIDTFAETLAFARPGQLAAAVKAFDFRGQLVQLRDAPPTPEADESSA